MISIVSILVLVIVSTVSIEGAAVGSNCGAGGDAIRLSSMSLKPDPIKLPSGSSPSPALFSLNVQMSHDIVNPIKTEVILEKKVLFLWVKAPCENNVGTCNYNHWCDLCTQPQCQCSYKAGSHKLDMTLNILSSVPTGEYRARIQFTSATGQKGCVSIGGIQITN